MIKLLLVCLLFPVFSYSQEIDTTILFVKVYGVNEYDKYQRLDDKNKCSVDSLKSLGVSMLDNSYLFYESIYMNKGKKVERFYDIENNAIVIYDYLFQRNDKSNGYRLLRTKKI